MATHRNGDVAARVIMRFEEISESVRLIRDILTKLPEGSLVEKIADAPDGKLGIGWVEAGAARLWLRCTAAKTTASTACTRMILRGRTGRCWSTPSSAISCRISR